MNIAATDLAILVVYLSVMAGLGVRVGRGRDLDDYVLGGRDQPWWLLLASIVATETSTVTFLSVPAFAFTGDLTWLQLPAGYILGRGLVAWWLVPYHRTGGPLTAYEHLGARFGRFTRAMISMVFLSTRTIADGLRLFLTALVLQEVVGWPLWLSVAVLALVTTAYSLAGGMRAVLWADLVQLIVYTGGACLAGIVLLDRLPGGWSEVTTFGVLHEKWRVIDLNLDWSEPYTLGAGVIGGAFLSLGSHGVDQMLVQRLLAARSDRDARLAVTASGVFVFAQFALFLALGVGLAAFYDRFPPAIAFERADRVFAHFIVRELPAGSVGIVLGGVLAAAMSTLSSSLHSCAATAAHDLGAGARRDPLPSVKRWVVAFAVGQSAVAVAGSALTSTVVAAVLAVTGSATGLVLGVFGLARSVPDAREFDVSLGFAVGAAVLFAAFYATPLAWPWYPVLGSLATFAAGSASCQLRRTQ